MYIHIKDSKIINTEQVSMICITKKYNKPNCEWWLTAISGGEEWIIEKYPDEFAAEIALNAIMGAIRDGAKTFCLDTFSA